VIVGFEDHKYNSILQVRNAKIYSKDEHFMEQQAILAFAQSRAQGQNPGKRKNEDEMQEQGEICRSRRIDIRKEWGRTYWYSNVYIPIAKN
jgi:hypothetical protein